MRFTGDNDNKLRRWRVLAGAGTCELEQVIGRQRSACVLVCVCVFRIQGVGFRVQRD